MAVNRVYRLARIFRRWPFTNRVLSHPIPSCARVQVEKALGRALEDDEVEVQAEEGEEREGRE